MMTTVTQLEKGSDVWLFEVVQPEHNHKPSPLKKQKRKQAETPEETIIRITNKQRSKATFFECSSDEDEDPIIIESGDDEVEDEAEDEVEDEAEDEVENEAEKRISASRRSQRNIQLPVRYRG